MVVLVTGSSRGIGAATIKEFAARGHDVVINYSVSADEAYALQESINQYSGRSLVIKCDISDEEQVKSMVNTIMQAFGTIDILINNAGIAIDSDFNEQTVENFRKTLNTNLIGTYLVSKYVGNIMLNNKSGSIVNISSTNGIDTQYPESIDYDASKAGILSLTRNFAKAYAPYVRVNAVCPGWVNTKMNENLTDEFRKRETDKILLGRFAEPEEIATAIFYVAQHPYINDSIIRVDGGERP
ncbi:MAG: SDR family oxidoreductase [Bacilli bacterium]|nr:SDR family oxidoreductase [Bacilli bacterium]